MSKAAQLQAKVANLPESVASELLDFLDFVTSQKSPNIKLQPDAIARFRGAFKGRLSSSNEFAEQKVDEID
jgi:hypothetical protein